MAYETSRKRTERVSKDLLLESVDIITEYLHEELREFEAGEEIPKEHVAFHVQRLTQWRNQPQESATAKGHKGWGNYETWLTNLWLTNDSQTYLHWQDRASLAFEQATIDSDELFTRRETASLLLIKQMKLELKREEKKYCSFEQDLYRSAFEQIQWDEIATTFIDEVTE